MCLKLCYVTFIQYAYDKIVIDNLKRRKGANKNIYYTNFFLIYDLRVYFIAYIELML